MDSFIQVGWRCGAALVCLLWASTVSASEPLNSEALIDEVLQRHPGAQALQQTLRAAQARVGAAGSLPDPQLNWTLAPNTIADDELGTRQNWQLAQTLPWPGKLALQRDVAMSASQIQAMDLASLRLHIVEQVRRHYGQWYLVHQALAINTDEQALLAELATVATQHYASGRGSQQAVLQAQLRGANLRRENLALQQRKRSLLAAINALRDRPLDTPLAAPAAWSGGTQLPPLPDLLARAQDMQPALLGLKARRLMSEQRASLVERDVLPDVRVSLGHVGTMDPAEKRLQAGISLNLPLNFSRRRHDIEAARAEAQSAIWAQRDLAGQTAAAVASAHAQVVQARATLNLYEAELLPLARQNLAAARADWRSGAGDFQAVIDAEQQLLDTRLGAERTRVDEWTARAALARQVADPSLKLFAQVQP